MLEQLNNVLATHGGEDATPESISRKDTNLSWLAGFIDGEGCIWAGTRVVNGGVKLIILVTITNANPLAIRKVTEILSSYGVGFSIQAMQPKSKSRAQGTVRVEGKGRVSKLLALIIQYLVVKRRRAELMQELIEYRTSLANNYTGNLTDDSAKFVKTVANDTHIQYLIGQLKDETNNYPSVLDFSRKPNIPFGESSETIRLPQVATTC